VQARLSLLAAGLGGDIAAAGERHAQDEQQDGGKRSQAARHGLGDRRHEL
jgi:hypothetical protein